MVELQTRHAEAETRRVEDLAWREKVRAEDLAWREKVRAEDLAWREKVRAEDLIWREKVRTEDLFWREKVRVEDRAERNAFNFESKQCLARGLAFIAAAQNAKLAAPTEDLARNALDFAQWIGAAARTVDKGT